MNFHLLWLMPILAVQPQLNSCTEPALNSTKSATKNIIENFEQKASKNKYEAGNVGFATGDWRLDNALIGNTVADVHNDLRSIRIKQGGTLMPQFEISGAQTISFQAALYGEKDKNGTVQVFISEDSGKNWREAAEPMACESGKFMTVTVSVPKAKAICMYIKNTSVRGCRVNIDDVVISGQNLKTTPITLPITTELVIEEVKSDEFSDPEMLPDPTPKPTKTNSTAENTDNEHLILGNPSGAVHNDRETDNYLITKKEFCLSYNSSKGTPNWVAWRGGKEWNGTVARSNNFRPDTDIPQKMYRATPSAYTNSGFDKGHLCSSGDRDNDAQNNSQTFLMTNIMPQAPNNNQGAWNALELYCRDLVDKGMEMYTYAGAYGKGGIGKNSAERILYLDGTSITVPAYTWKIVVILPDGSNDLSRINKDTRVIAIWMPNTQAVGKYNWRDYICDVKYIEDRTGYQFFSTLPKDVQAALKTKKETAN